jgi:chaperonin cofactor prefoldin
MTSVSPINALKQQVGDLKAEVDRLEKQAFRYRVQIREMRVEIDRLRRPLGWRAHRPNSNKAIHQ